jgi:hypothetical protein
MITGEMAGSDTARPNFRRTPREAVRPMISRIVGDRLRRPPTVDLRDAFLEICAPSWLPDHGSGSVHLGLVGHRRLGWWDLMSNLPDEQRA